jgi:hypothetical protein
MSRPYKVFRYSIGSFQKVALARSRAEFGRIIGASSSELAYVSETGNEKDIARANEAGVGFYMENYGKGWQRTESKAVKEAVALEEARALASGSGNAPPVAIEQGETIKGQFSSTVVRYVVIEGERRGRWERTGARWFLSDMTGHRVKSKTRWWVSHDGVVSSHDYSEPFHVVIEPWKEAAALRAAMQAWEDDQLPPLPEQEARRAKREAEKAAKDAEKAMLGRLEPHLGDLVRFLERSDSPEAARLLGIMRGKP